MLFNFDSLNFVKNQLNLPCITVFIIPKLNFYLYYNKTLYFAKLVVALMSTVMYLSNLANFLSLDKCLRMNPPSAVCPEKQNTDDNPTVVSVAVGPTVLLLLKHFNLLKKTVRHYFHSNQYSLPIFVPDISYAAFADENK